MEPFWVLHRQEGGAVSIKFINFLDRKPKSTVFIVVWRDFIKKISI